MIHLRNVDLFLVVVEEDKNGKVRVVHINKIISDITT